MSGTFDDGILVALLWIGWSLSSINHHLRQSNRKETP